MGYQAASETTALRRNREGVAHNLGLSFINFWLPQLQGFLEKYVGILGETVVLVAQIIKVS